MNLRTQRVQSRYAMLEASLLGAIMCCIACQGELNQPSATSGAGRATGTAPSSSVPVATSSGSGDGWESTPETNPNAIPSPGAIPSAGEATDPNLSAGPVTAPSTGVAPEPSGAEFQPFQPAPGMLRRLTRTQFRNAMRDEFDAAVDVHELDADSWNGDFAVIGASTVVTSERGVEQYQASIERAVTAVFADPARQVEFTGCALDVTVDDPCVRDFIEAVGRRAWRRPLEIAEVERLLTLAQNAAAELDSTAEGLRWATVSLFTSPNFLYRVELGEPGLDGSQRLTAFELASRLAFLLWNRPPDDALLEQAASGLLGSPEGIRAAASAMLDAPAGREAAGAFAEEYMRLDRIGTQAKDPSAFPEYGPALQAAMVRDMRAAWEALVLDQGSSTMELFTTPKVVVNAELAELYGIDASGLDSDTFEEAELPADSPRVGLLGKAGFLSQFANQKEGSPTLRGKFIRQALMCTPIPPPPGDADIVLDEPPEGMPLTKRERLELHRTSPACAGCHSLMDPLGLPFETFDAVGRFRTTDLGLPIDPSGEFDGQHVADSREFGAAMAASDAVMRCLVSKYYAYAMGHEVRAADLGVVDALASSFRDSGFDWRALTLDLVTHEAFSSVSSQP